MSPDFLTLDEVLEIHRDQIERYGGGEGIRDLGLLQSALAQPSATFGGQFLHADLQEMAAAYLFHLVQNHPFLDGNKRVGAAAAITFLFMNNLDISRDANRFVGVQVKSLSQRAPVPLGLSLEKVMGDFWVIVNQIGTNPSTFVLLPAEVKDLAHRGEKDGRVSYWLQPRKYENDLFRDAWHRIGNG